MPRVPGIRTSLAECYSKTSPSSRLCLDLEQKRVALTSAGADRGKAQTPAVSAQLVHHRPDDPRTRGADRMSERDGATVHVHGLLPSAEQPRRVEHD